MKEMWEKVDDDDEDDVSCFKLIQEGPGMVLLGKAVLIYGNSIQCKATNIYTCPRYHFDRRGNKFVLPARKEIIKQAN